MDINERLATGRASRYRHGHQFSEADSDYGEPIDYTPHEESQFVANTKLYESFWGPVPSLHDSRVYHLRLAAWLKSDESQETPRGKFLASKPDLTGINPATRRWIYNESDLRAAQDGCRFEAAFGQMVCTWFEAELILYEGPAANHRFRLLAWQRELLMRLFGWLKFSKDYDRWIRRFTKASIWVPKKNGKSPLGAGVGLYLFIADGEGGQKVFNIASILKQSLIVHKHAEAFVRRKDRAKGKHNDWGCHVFKSLGNRYIHHEGTDSEYSAVSGENPSSLEGLNAGGIVLDEAHIMDPVTAATLEESGNSRPQPLQFEISTAGNDLQGYGKRQYDYGRAVEAGHHTDHGFFFMGYGIFEGNQFDPDDPKTWQRCNPSWFVTIKPQSYRESYDRAKQKGLREFNKFCMYKLNKWIAAASAWLDPDEFGACNRKFDMPLAGESVWCGVDLARCRDMSALTATWRRGADILQRTWLWITEDFVEANNDRADWKLWEEFGDIVIVPGATIATSWVREQIESLASEYSLECVVYDERFAIELVQWMEHVAFIEHVAFPQSGPQMAGPLDEFEAAVKENRLWVYPNQCLIWQAQHCSVKDSPTGGRVLVKPGHGEFKKIDGMVSGTMSLWASSSVEARDTGSMFLPG